MATTTKKAVEETTDAIAIETTEKAPKTKSDDAARIKELEAQVAEVDALKAQLAQMQAMMTAFMSGGMINAGAQKTSSLDEEVKIVHLVERAPGLTTHIQLTNMALDMSKFGEERTLDRRQVEELVGKYRKLFDTGVLAFANGYDELAKKFQVRDLNAYALRNTDYVQKLGKLSLVELEDLYNRLCDGHKAFIIEYFKRKVIEGNSDFNDIHKIELLNRLSDGELDGTLLDMRNKK